MTAAATAVKEITLTFNKAVADTTVAKITVKKGNATPTFTAKWADDKKSVVLAMDSKLTKGTYDVTVSGLEKEDLTASVTVEDQKVTGFQLLSTNLVAGALPVTCGTIKFKGVDQYGNFMNAGNVTVSSSFGTLFTKSADMSNDANATNTFSTSSDPTTVYVKITSAMAILGTKGTITIVGGNGVNLTSEITLVEPSKAVKVESLGLYNTDKKKFMDMTAGDDASKYVIALKFTNQYDVELSFDEAKDQAIAVTVAGGTTNVDSKKNADGKVVPEEVTIDGKKVYAIRLVNTAKAGNIQATVVNPSYGLLDNLSFTVAPGTVIKSFSVSADNDVYAGENNTLSYTAIDAEGNEVTKYDVLSKALTGTVIEKDADGKDIKVTKVITPDDVTLEKQADGSAKLIYHPTTTASNGDFTGSELKSLMFTLYPGETNILVAQTTVKVNQARVIWEVNGIDTSKVTATASASAIRLKPTDFKIADQYGNTLTSDQIKNAWVDGKSIIVDDSKATKWTAGKVGKADAEISFTPAEDVADGDVEFVVKAADNGTHKDEGFKLQLSKVNAGDASDFAIEWTNGQKVFNVKNGGLKLNISNDFSVVGRVSGKKVEIPKENYSVISGDFQAQNDGSKETISKAATLKIAVTDAEHKTHIIESEYTYSNENAKLTKIDSGDKTSYDKLSDLSVADLLTKDNTAGAFKLLDQYGELMDSVPSDVTADISITAGEGYVEFNGTNKATVKASAGKTVDKIVVTLTCGSLTKTVTVTITK